MRARPTRTSLCLLSQQLCADVWLLLWRSMSEPQRRSVRIKTHQGSCTAEMFWAFSIILAFSVSRYRLDHAAAVVLSPPAPASQGSITRTSWSVWETRVPCSLVEVNSPSLLPQRTTTYSHAVLLFAAQVVCDFSNSAIALRRYFGAGFTIRRILDLQLAFEVLYGHVVVDDAASILWAFGSQASQGDAACR